MIKSKIKNKEDSDSDSDWGQIIGPGFKINYSNLDKKHHIQEKEVVGEYEKERGILKIMKKNISDIFKCRDLSYLDSLELDCKDYGFITYDYSSHNLKKHLTELTNQINKVQENISSHSFAPTPVDYNSPNSIQSRHDPFINDIRGSGNTLPSTVKYDTTRWVQPESPVKPPPKKKIDIYKVLLS